MSFQLGFILTAPASHRSTPINMAVVCFEVDALPDKLLDKGCASKQKFLILGQLVIL